MALDAAEAAQNKSSAAAAAEKDAATNLAAAQESAAAKQLAADQAADSRKAELDELLAGPIDDSDDGVPTANPYQLMAQLGSVMEQALAVRCKRAFASGEQSIDYLHGTVGPTVHLAVGGDGDAAHRVVCSGLDGY